MRISSLGKPLFAAGVVLALIPVLLAAPVKPLPVEPSPSRAERLRDNLTQPITFVAAQDWTLKDSLEWLTNKYALKFEIDFRAFEAKKIKDVQGVNIAPGEAWKLEGSALKDVVRAILKKLPLGDSEATYVILGDVIFVTTEEMAPYRWMRQQVSIDCEKAQLSSVLKKLAHETGANLVIDPKAAKEGQMPVSLQVQDVTLETAICLLAEMTDLKPVRVGNVLFLTTKANAAEMRADKERAALIGPCPLPSEPKVPSR